MTGKLVILNAVKDLSLPDPNRAVLPGISTAGSFGFASG
jgi:hypothetical protein